MRTLGLFRGPWHVPTLIGRNLPDSENDFPRNCGNDLHRGPGPKKRGDRGRRCTAGRIERGGGNGGDPVRSPQGRLEVSLAVWLIPVSRNVCGRAG